MNGREKPLTRAPAFPRIVAQRRAACFEASFALTDGSSVVKPILPRRTIYAGYVSTPFSAGKAA